MPRTPNPIPSDPAARSAELRERVRGSGKTRNEAAEILGVTRRALDHWMLPDASAEHRNPPAAVVKLARMLLRSH